MSRRDVDVSLKRAECLALSMNNFVPNEPRSIQFRADLAGLLVVDLVASYENCVKETIVSYASKHHARFGVFAQNQFSRLNSKITIRDLHRLTKNFDQDINDQFIRLLKKRKEGLSRRIGQDPTKSYQQILDWRHDFAHAGVRNTTIEEAARVHKIAKRVLYAFNEAFD